MEKESSKTVLVLGIARSGTSVVAGLLHYMGVDMNPVDNRRDGYPYGSFEDIEIQTLTKILSTNLKNRKIIGKKTISRIKQLINIRSQKNNIWGWKSALTYRCIDCFMKYIINPYFVIVFRNIEDHAISIKEHFRINYGKTISLSEAVELINTEKKILLSAIEKYKNVPRIIIRYNEFENNISALAIRLSDFLDLELNEKKMEKISNLYISKNKRYGKEL